jgi:hypothetical protein
MMSNQEEEICEDQFNDDRKYVELRFMIVILEFFNYHISMAKREHNSRMKVRWLVKNLFPTFKEMRISL